MAHVMKYTKASYGHMLKHYERAKDKNGEYVKFGNENIDLERTPLNYNLARTVVLRESLSGIAAMKCIA